MTHWTTIRNWTRKRFAVTLDWAWEDYPDLSWDDDGEITAKCESGDYGVYAFRVRVTLDGREVAASYLGNSIYSDPEAFYTEHLGIAKAARDAGYNFGVHFTDMMREAIGDARQALSDPPRIRHA